MTLINWSGAIFGPGSEWLWSMLQFIIVVVTLFGIYRQMVNARGSAVLARQETFFARWQSPTLALARLRVLIALRDGSYEAGDVNATEVLMFMENLASLREAGGYSDEALDGEWSWVIRPWWRLLEPQIRADRQSLHPRVWSGFEDMEMVCRRLDEKSGVERPVLAGPFDYAGPIARARQRMQLLYGVEARVMPAE